MEFVLNVHLGSYYRTEFVTDKLTTVLPTIPRLTFADSALLDLLLSMEDVTDCPKTALLSTLRKPA